MSMFITFSRWLAVTATLAVAAAPLPGDDAAESLPSPASLRAGIEAIQVPDVAWRRIPWNSCLLDGLREARATRKPLVVWVFIDRPVDDTRC